MVIKKCPICSKEFKVRGTAKRCYCSRKCMSEGYKERMKGTSNPNYRHGPKFCKYCEEVVCPHAKGNGCIKCIGKEKVGEKNSFYGKKHTEKTKQKMSENHYDCSGENSHFYGKKHTEEFKQALSVKKKEQWLNFSDEEKKPFLDALRRGCLKQLAEKGNTKPERIVVESLNKLNIKYKQNELLYDKFFVDFLLEDGTVIEAFGDYWHANPLVFTNLNAHQIKQTGKDKSRIAYLTKCGHRVIVLWEKDLKSNPNLVEEVLNERKTIK